MTVRNLDPASKQQRALARAIHVRPDRNGCPPLEAKLVLSQLPILHLQPLWPHRPQLKSRSTGKPLVLEASKSIQYP